MKRLHLFEFNDQVWLPKVIRDGFAHVLKKHVEDIYLPIVPKLQEFFLLSGTKTVLDMGSGTGGPWFKLLPELQDRGVDISIKLSDRFPEGLPPPISPYIQSLDQHIDATQLPKGFADCLTLFSTFHHFCPDQARNMLQQAADQKQTIGIFEFTEPNWQDILGMLLSPVAVMLTIPLLRPFHWQYLIFTYLIPIIPLVYLWDGMVSHMRSYTLKDIQLMISKLETQDYSWEFGQIEQVKSGTKITYILGRKA